MEKWKLRLSEINSCLSEGWDGPWTRCALMHRTCPACKSPSQTLRHTGAGAEADSLCYENVHTCVGTERLRQPEGKSAVGGPLYGCCPMIFASAVPLAPSSHAICAPQELCLCLPPHHTSVLLTPRVGSSPPGFRCLLLFAHLLCTYSMTWLNFFEFSLATTTHI